MSTSIHHESFGDDTRKPTASRTVLASLDVIVSTIWTFVSWTWLTLLIMLTISIINFNDILTDDFFLKSSLAKVVLPVFGPLAHRFVGSDAVTIVAWSIAVLVTIYVPVSLWFVYKYVEDDDRGFLRKWLYAQSRPARSYLSFFSRLAVPALVGVGTFMFPLLVMTFIALLMYILMPTAILWGNQYGSGVLTGGGGPFFVLAVIVIIALIVWVLAALSVLPLLYLIFPMFGVVLGVDPIGMIRIMFFFCVLPHLLNNFVAFGYSTDRFYAQGVDGGNMETHQGKRGFWSKVVGWSVFTTIVALPYGIYTANEGGPNHHLSR